MVKAKIGPSLVLFLHEDMERCFECCSAYKLLGRMEGHFKRKGISLQRITDDSFQNIFVNEKFPLLRIESMPPRHYSGVKEIQDYILAYGRN